MTTARRRGFTLLEVTAALAVLLLAATLTAQLAVWGVREVARSRSRQMAQEFAANVLESARAEHWEVLGASWAKAQHLPPSLADGGWHLTVVVATEPNNRLAKRVTVTIEPSAPGGGKPVPVQLAALFGPRTAPAEGG
jgi:prepilin-type N-terminal cleavage/methylation domain-containing protein